MLAERDYRLFVLGYSASLAGSAMVQVALTFAVLNESIFATLWDTTMPRAIPAAILSRVSAYDWFGSLLCEPIGVALAAVVASAIGMSQTLWIAAAVTLVSIGALLAAPSVRQLQRLDEPQLVPSAG